MYKKKIRYALDLQFDEFYHKRQKYDNIYNQLKAKLDSPGNVDDYELGVEKLQTLMAHRQQDFSAFNKHFELIAL